MTITRCKAHPSAEDTARSARSCIRGLRLSCKAHPSAEDTASQAQGTGAHALHTAAKLIHPLRILQGPSPRVRRRCSSRCCKAHPSAEDTASAQVANLALHYRSCKAHPSAEDTARYSGEPLAKPDWPAAKLIHPLRILQARIQSCLRSRTAAAKLIHPLRILQVRNTDILAWAAEAAKLIHPLRILQAPESSPCIRHVHAAKLIHPLRILQDWPD